MGGLLQPGNRADGLFACWQAFHIQNVIRKQMRSNEPYGWRIGLDLILLGLGAYGTYVSVEWLVHWLSTIQSGFISAKYMGWLSAG